MTFRPRCAVATQSCDLRTTVLGMPLALPLHAGAGWQQPHVLSTRRGSGRARRRRGRHGSTPCRRSPAASSKTSQSGVRGPVWYQLYLVGGRDVRDSARLSARAQAGYSALVVTIDTPVAGMRERDVRNGTKELLAAQARADVSVRLAVSARAALARRFSAATAA